MQGRLQGELRHVHGARWRAFAPRLQSRDCFQVKTATSAIISETFWGCSSGDAGMAAHYQRVLRRAAKPLTIQPYRSDMVECVNTLTSLRRGDVDGVMQRKEHESSAALYAWQAAFGTNTLADRDTLRAYRLAAHHGATHPFATGDGRVDSMVPEALAAAFSLEWGTQHPAEPRPQPRMRISMNRRSVTPTFHSARAGGLSTSVHSAAKPQPTWDSASRLSGRKGVEEKGDNKNRIARNCFAGHEYSDGE